VLDLQYVENTDVYVVAGAVLLVAMSLSTPRARDGVSGRPAA